MSSSKSFRQPVSDRLSNDLGAFVRAAWPVLDTQPLQWSWFHELICEYLTLCRRRVIKRFLLTIPPRMAKSTIVSVAFPCWQWIIDPQASFIAASFGDILATNLSVKRRMLMQSTWFQRMFPGRVSFASDQNQKNLYENTAGGRMYSVPMGGQVMGMGANYLILDDPMSPAISYSDVERQNVLREISSTWRSRFNNPMDDVMIVVQQRVHANDPAGYFLRTEKGQWTHLNLPMIAERDETITFPISGRTMHRPEGDLLHPERFDKAWCENEREKVGPHVWAAQYQQKPVPSGGLIFKSAWFRHYATPFGGRRGAVVQSWDTAYLATRRSDYSVCTTWTFSENAYFLLSLWRGKVEFAELLRQVANQAEEWRPTAIVLEQVAGANYALQELKRATRYPVIGQKPDKDKIARAQSVTGLFQAGKVFFPEGAAWLPDLEDELVSFPGLYDDQVDSVTQGLNYLRNLPRGNAVRIFNAFTGEDITDSVTRILL